MRILLAEDERSLSKALVRILEKNNYAVDAVYNGRDALTYIQTGEYDAAVLDIMMPEMNGLDVLHALRREDCELPVLMLTAKTSIDDRVLGLDSGANDYLSKPFDTRELLARIRAMTRQKRSDSSRLSFGNVTLDRATFELSGPEGSFRLASKEFQMMETLISNPGHLISTDRFMEKIWGYDSNVEINVVWVYISYLRKKLTALEADIQIKSARNAGYTLEKKS